MPKRLLLPRSQAVGLDGRPLAGTKLYTYVTGTSTPKPVFTDAALTVAHANPVIADAAGRFPAMFLGAGDYRTELRDAADVVIHTDDPVEGDAAAAAGEVALAGLAARRNRIVNGAMQVSQQNGTANVDCTTDATYTLDQWVAALGAGPGGTLRVAQVASITPGGSPFRLRATAQVADATIAAADYYILQQSIEGAMVADARFGLATAKQVFVRFGVRSSIAGTFAVALRNAATNRSYVGLITIGAGEVNTDLLRTLTIPGDVAGTWLTDNSAGMVLSFTLACGSTFQGTANAWSAGNILTTAGQTNFMATPGATFDLFDVGLYVDALGLGIFPPWELPALDEDLRRCQRYFCRVSAGLIGWSGAASQSLAQTYAFPVEMRAVPTATAGGTITNVNVASEAALDITEHGFLYNVTTTAGGTGTQLTGRFYIFSARL